MVSERRIGRGGVRGAPGLTTMPVPVRDAKICASCGRPFEWRARLAKSWDRVRYCSRACRARGVNATDERLEHRIAELLDARAACASICPSEAARSVAPAEHAWRSLMEPARRAARRLAHRGKVVITQRGRVVDPGDIRGPIRIRRVR